MSEKENGADRGRGTLARSVSEGNKPAGLGPFSVLLGGALIALLIYSVAVFWLSRAADDLCANEPITIHVSPNGTLKAVLFRRDCGATTPYSMQVSIIPVSHQLPNEGGNVFVQSGEPAMAVRWIDDHHLNIVGGGASTTFVRLTDYRGVRIPYD